MRLKKNRKKNRKKDCDDENMVLDSPEDKFYEQNPSHLAWVKDVLSVLKHDIEGLQIICGEKKVGEAVFRQTMSEFSHRLAQIESEKNQTASETARNLFELQRSGQETSERLERLAQQFYSGCNAQEARLAIISEKCIKLSSDLASQQEKVGGLEAQFSVQNEAVQRGVFSTLQNCPERAETSVALANHQNRLFQVEQEVRRVEKNFLEFSDQQERQQSLGEGEAQGIDKKFRGIAIRCSVT